MNEGLENIKELGQVSKKFSDVEVYHHRYNPNYHFVECQEEVEIDTEEKRNSYLRKKHLEGEFSIPIISDGLILVYNLKKI